MGHRVVRGEMPDTGSHQRPAAPDLLVEGHGVGLDSGIGDQPGLQVTSPGGDGGESADEPVQRQPVHPVFHAAPPFPAVTMPSPLRSTAPTRQPLRWNGFAPSRPIPLPAPVMKTDFTTVTRFRPLP